MLSRLAIPSSSRSISRSINSHQLTASSHFCSPYSTFSTSAETSSTLFLQSTQQHRQRTMSQTAATKHEGPGKARTALDEMAQDGAFKRKESTYREHVKKGGRFEPEAGRYHLYISYACPWANRTLAALYLKGLEHSIGVSMVHPTWQRTKPDDPSDMHTGWTFASPDDPNFSSPNGHGSFPPTHCVPDTVNEPPAKFIRDLYEWSKDTSGKYTVPVLWDKKEKTIVNNESSEILRMFNSEFQDLAKNPGLDLYPEALRAEIDAINEWVYPNINNGVYRCGFATGQAAYEEAFKGLFAALDRVEGILSKQRYIAGDVLTEADIRLFMTLIRFDEIYVVYFKTNRNFIKDFPHTSEYVRELYNIEGIGRSVDMYHCKTHYFSAHPKLNFYAIVPIGPGPWYKEKPTTREKLGGKRYS